MDDNEYLQELENEFADIRGGEVDPDYSPFLTAITLSVGTVYHQEHYCDHHGEVHPESNEDVFVIGLFLNGSEEEEEKPMMELMISAEGHIGKMITSGEMGKILKKRLKKMNQ